jgi:hypothetical protein
MLFKIITKKWSKELLLSGISIYNIQDKIKRNMKKLAN